MPRAVSCWICCFARDGQTLGELEAELEMSRFGVMKHLKVPEQAVVTGSARRSTREAALPERRADSPDSTIAGSTRPSRTGPSPW